jgi:hypothetical protein
VAKTKSVDGKEYPASTFAYVGDANDPGTWHLPVMDKAHAEDALARFNQTDIPAAAKKRVAMRLMSAAKKFGIDASGFAGEHGMKASEAAEEVSFEELQTALQQALLDKFGRDDDGYRQYCLCETFPDYLIAQGPDGELYRIAYTAGADEENITLGEPEEVETAYVPVAESAKFLATESAGTEEGWSWPVQVMESGRASGTITDASGQVLAPHYFPPEIVAQVAQAVNGARFRRRHPPVGSSGADAPELTAGWVSDGKMVGSGAQAKINLLKSEPEIRAKLMAAREAGKLDLFSVSIAAYFGFKGAKLEGKPALIATSLQRFEGLDMCAEPGAGGRFLQVAASHDVLAEISALQTKAVKCADGRITADKKVSPITTQGEGHGSPRGAGRNLGGTMKESILKVLEALRKIDAGRAAELEKELGNLSADKHSEFFAKVTEAIAEGLPRALVSNAPAALAAADILTSTARAALDQQNLDVLAKATEALAGARKIQFGSALERKLTDSKLPVPAASLVREHFAGVVGDEKAIDAYIVKVRESFAAFAEVGKVGAGGTIEVGRNSLDKIQLAMDAMMGVKEATADRNVRPFRGLKEAYIYCTGDADMRLDKGGFFRVSEAIATTDFPNILLSSLTKKLIQDYQEYQIVPGLEKLYTATVLGDYKPQDRVRMGYLGDLPTVAEAAVYTELTKPTDEKITYSIVKKGGLLTISEETIRNDDLGKIAQFPNRLARAARHTLATFISNFFITPPNYDPDGLAWFHATHTNTGTTALSSAELDVRAIALAKQSEKDSGNRLGLTLDWIMIPIDLRPSAMQINRNMLATNNWYQKFGVNEENIIVNPLLTDVTDWFGGSFPAAAPFLEIGFLDGYQTPQLFIANLPTQGTQFTNDQLQYKAKFVFGGKPIDFRGVFKEVVAG